MPLPFVFLLPAAKAVAASAVSALPVAVKSVQTARRIAGYAASPEDATQPEDIPMSRDYALKSDTPSRGATNTGITLGAVALGIALLSNSSGNGGIAGLFGGGHNHNNDRLARLEAGQAALAVEVQKNAEIETMRSGYERQITKAYVKEETCDCIRGRLYLPPTRLADHYDSEPRFIDSHTHHRGCGCAGGSGAAGGQEA